MKNSFIVDVARDIGIEAAILENEICYLAPRYGDEIDDEMYIEISVRALRRKYDYFSLDVLEVLESLNCYKGIILVTSEDERYVYTMVPNEWLEERGLC